MKKWTRKAVIGVWIASLTVAALAAETERGLKVGDKIPAFAASDETGKVRRFAELRGSKGLLIIIFRSASW